MDSTKFLGVIINQNLSWQPHIKAISSKIANNWIIIKSPQFFLPNTLHTLYNSLILPYLQYCSIIWASTYSSHLQPLFRLQKKDIRTITHSPRRAHTYPLFSRLKILNIFNIYKHQVSCFIFLHMQKLLQCVTSKYTMVVATILRSSPPLYPAILKQHDMYLPRLTPSADLPQGS